MLLGAFMRIDLVIRGVIFFRYLCIGRRVEGGDENEKGGGSSYE